MLTANPEPRRLPSEKISELISRDVLDEKAPKVVQKVVDKLSTIKIMKYICLFFVALSAITSVYFIYKWNEPSRGPVLGMIIALIMTGCQILLPELTIFLFMKKKAGSAFGGVGTGFISLIATVFTIVATIGGLYDSRTESMRTRAAMDNTTNTAESMAIKNQLASAQERREITLKAIENYQADEKIYSREVELALAGNGKSSYNAEVKRDLARKNIASKTNELVAIDKEISSMSANVLSITKPREDSYSWMGKMLGLSADTVEFGMNSFPAIFNEIVAPVVLAIVLFL